MIRPVRLVLTVEEAAECLGIGRTLMYALITAGEVESVRIGRLRRVPADALDASCRRSGDGRHGPEAAPDRTAHASRTVHRRSTRARTASGTAGSRSAFRTTGKPDRRHVMRTQADVDAARSGSSNGSGLRVGPQGRAVWTVGVADLTGWRTSPPRSFGTTRCRAIGSR